MTDTDILMQSNFSNNELNINKIYTKTETRHRNLLTTHLN